MFSHQDGNFIELLQSFESNNNWREFNDSDIQGITEIKDFEINISGYDYSLFQWKERKGKTLIHITPKVYKVFQKQIKKAIKNGVIEKEDIVVQGVDKKHETTTITTEENAKYQEFANNRTANINHLMKKMGVGAGAIFALIFTVSTIVEIKSIVLGLSLACSYCISVLMEALRYCLDEADVCTWFCKKDKKDFLQAENSHINTIKTARYNLVVNSILAFIFLMIDLLCMYFKFSISAILTPMNCMIAATFLCAISTIMQFINKRYRVLTNIISSLGLALLIAAIRFI